MFKAYRNLSCRNRRLRCVHVRKADPPVLHPRSFHGYPQGFAQLIESPQNWHITPMQIDTRNREHGAQPTDVHKCMNPGSRSSFGAKTRF